MRKIKIGDTIREHREKKGYSLRHLANRVNLSHSFISDIEANRSRPSYENLLKICKTLDIPMQNFFLNNVRK